MKWNLKSKLVIATPLKNIRQKLDHFPQKNGVFKPPQKTFESHRDSRGAPGYQALKFTLYGEAVSAGKSHHIQKCREPGNYPPWN